MSRRNTYIENQLIAVVALVAFLITIVYLLAPRILSKIDTPEIDPQATTSGQEMGNNEPAPASTLGTVKSVYDGDTMTILVNGESWHLRLIGIDAPEMAHQGQQAQCGAVEARDRLRELAPKGSEVVVISDPKADTLDRYGRHLVYVSIDNIDLANVLVNEGFVGAWYPKGEPEPIRYPVYAETAESARANMIGFWPRCGTLGR